MKCTLQALLFLVVVVVVVVVVDAFVLNDDDDDFYVIITISSIKRNVSGTYDLASLTRSRNLRQWS